ncbi:MAG: class I SAM-dependent methyltransferase [Promethearchaeota archaeon]
MERKDQHYYTPLPDVKLKIFTVAESLRRHLYIFKTVPGIFSFKKIDLGTKLLIEHMMIPSEESNLLDIGCGYGPIGIVLAHESPKSQIYLVDINKLACWCARENVKTNISINKGRVQVLFGSFFEPIIKKNIKFDGIYMNPPLRLGRNVFFKIYEDVYKNLKPQGLFQFVMRKKMGAEYILKSLRKQYPEEKIEIICKRSGYWIFKCFHNE